MRPPVLRRRVTEFGSAVAAAAKRREEVKDFMMERQRTGRVYGWGLEKERWTDRQLLSRIEIMKTDLRLYQDKAEGMKEEKESNDRETGTDG
jgi:hypothetical protein